MSSYFTDYALMSAQIRGFLETDPSWLPTLSNASAVLKEMLQDVNWAGFYLLRGDKLVLGPFQGKPACIHIAVGKGVCGSAVRENRTLVVPDVHEFPGHIACDSASRSEIVVPVHDRAADEGSGRVTGVLDIDSPVKERFSREDREGMEQLVRILEENVRWNGW